MAPAPASSSSAAASPGLHVVRGLRRARVEVTLVDRQNFSLFQPLVYQVATGALSAAEVAAPLRSVFKRQQQRPRRAGRGHRLRPRAAPGDARPARERPAGAGARIRHAGRGRRLAVLLLRASRVGRACPAAEVARRGARHPQPGARRVRGGRGRARPRPAPGLAHVRRRGGGADRRRDGRPDRRARPRHAAARLPLRRYARRAGAPGRGRKPRAGAVSRVAVGAGAARRS